LHEDALDDECWFRTTISWGISRQLPKSQKYVTNRWRNKDEFVDVHDVFGDSIEEAKQLYMGLLVLRGSDPIKGELIANLGDAAQVLTFPGHIAAIFRKGRHCVNVTASSEAVAKRFAQYYDQAIADEK
jgi:hypothetical protein